jgi:hypothetical protein
LGAERDLVESGDWELDEEIADRWEDYQDFSPDEPPEYVRAMIADEREVTRRNFDIPDTTGRITVFQEERE